MDADSAASERRRQLATTAVIVVGFSAVRAVMETSFVFATRGVSWPVAIHWTTPSWVALMPLATAAVMLAGRFPFDRRNRAQSLLVHAAASVAFGLTHLAVITPFRVMMAGGQLRTDVLERAFIVAFRLLFYLDISTYWAIVGMSLALYYSNLRTSLAEARLAALRAQLNPHFLFNTLNAISTLALRGDRAAVTEMIGRLSSLLREALEARAEEIPVAREIEFLDDYVAIQQIRFADRLCIEKKIADDTLNALVPTMILLPLVENAIKHGVNVQRDIGHVNVSAARENGSLVIEVRDSGPGFRIAPARDGIGLANTRARLDQLYGSDSRFEYGNVSEGGASVRLTIPFHQQIADISRA
jgi:two-component system, LytTR family, sensor kinase